MKRRIVSFPFRTSSESDPPLLTALTFLLRSDLPQRALTHSHSSSSCPFLSISSLFRLRVSVPEISLSIVFTLPLSYDPFRQYMSPLSGLSGDPSTSIPKSQDVVFLLVTFLILGLYPWTPTPTISVFAILLID